MITTSLKYGMSDRLVKALVCFLWSSLGCTPLDSASRLLVMLNLYSYPIPTSWRLQRSMTKSHHSSLFSLFWQW
jgi:hypothetical protein